MAGIPTAVITGAGGFVATELVKQLLERGYNVRGTVRSLANAEKVQHLTRLSKALPGKLELKEADLLQVPLLQCLLTLNCLPTFIIVNL
jgi:GDP-D-mannose dehydratase